LDWFTHEFCRHFENIVGHCSREQHNLTIYDVACGDK
jgi:hypothetical protein